MLAHVDDIALITPHPEKRSEELRKHVRCQVATYLAPGTEVASLGWMLRQTQEGFEIDQAERSRAPETTTLPALHVQRGFVAALSSLDGAPLLAAFGEGR
jgi:hypothetical protein